MKGFPKNSGKSKQAVIDLASGELVADKEPPYVRPPWFRARLAYKCVGESRAQQSHKDLTDINNIVDRYARTGGLPPARMEPSYADVTELQGDLGERIKKSREIIATADRHFEKQKTDQLKAEKEKAKDADKVRPTGTDQLAQSADPSQADTSGGSPSKK